MLALCHNNSMKYCNYFLNKCASKGYNQQLFPDIGKCYLVEQCVTTSGGIKVIFGQGTQLIVQTRKFMPLLNWVHMFLTSLNHL